MMLFACGTNTNQQQVVVSNNEVEVTDSLVDSVTEPEFDSVLFYLDNPVDFSLLKKKTTGMHSGGNIRLENKYFLPIEDDNSIYYDYWAIEFHENFEDDGKPLCFKAIKPWGSAEDRYYETDNEVIVGIKSRIEWEGLQQSNFVDQSKSDILNKFGQPDTTISNCLIYQRNDKLITLKIENERVEWFKYFWLNDTVNFKTMMHESLLNW
jgi:hypothetical protein